MSSTSKPDFRDATIGEAEHWGAGWRAAVGRITDVLAAMDAEAGKRSLEPGALRVIADGLLITMKPPA